jgi:ABC-2 type transport system ATP-binding protein
MIKIMNLKKYYGNVKAVDGLNLNIKEGEIFGFVGPNGAGKTTTLKMIATLLKKDSGKILFNEKEIEENVFETRNVIGYMPDFFGVYDKLKVIEYLDFYADIHQVKGNRDKIFNDLLELVELTDKKDEYVDSLSRGMKQRLCLARALVHNPKILLLDEPASGLDPRARVQMKEILLELRKMGKTIIISSHILPELAEICTLIGIINKGKMVSVGSIEEINYEIHGNSPFEFRFDNDIKFVERSLKEMINIDIIQIEEKHALISATSDIEDYDVLKELVVKNIKVTEFIKKESNLEDLFMKLTRDDEND